MKLIIQVGAKHSLQTANVPLAMGMPNTPSRPRAVALMINVPVAFSQIRETRERDTAWMVSALAAVIEAQIY